MTTLNPSAMDIISDPTARQACVAAHPSNGANARFNARPTLNRESEDERSRREAWADQYVKHGC